MISKLRLTQVLFKEMNCPMHGKVKRSEVHSTNQGIDITTISIKCLNSICTFHAKLEFIDASDVFTAEIGAGTQSWHWSNTTDYSQVLEIVGDSIWS